MNLKRGKDICVELDGVTLIHQNQPGLWVHEHAHEHHEIIIPLDGEVQVTVLGNVWTVRPDQMFWLPAETAHSFASSSDSSGERLIILFDPKLWKKWFGTNRSATLFPSHQLIKEIAFYVLLKRSSSTVPAFIDALVATISDVVTQHAELSVHAKKEDLSEMVKKAKQILSDSFTEEITVEQLAGKLGISSRSLSRLFAAEVGISPKQLLTRYRIQEACRLLRDTKLSVTDVAFECGFGSMSRFLDSFRAQVGILPSDFRFGRKP